MVDNLSKEARSKNMRAIRSTGTKLEATVSKELWRRGIRFRKNVKGLMGKPDIAIKKYKLVVFVDSCFWHVCDIHFRMPKSNLDYWEAKIERNRKRDRAVNAYYQEIGWTVLRFWDHEVKDDINGVIDSISKVIEAKRNKILDTKDR
ncbi:very short patch repair endonuclease [Paenibacillus sp. KR2-11]|uniref:very short patch repair endonuclease n=1 Tax=Paenibacillus sp. KR2-11 TaxID=3385500 RepID=UPI0038FBF256